jgi:hypothetical protein
MTFGPIAKGRQRLVEDSSQRGERVLNRRWHRSERIAADQPVAFEIVQGLGQDLLRDAVDAATEFAEAVRAFREYMGSSIGAQYFVKLLKADWTIAGTCSG